MSTSSYTRRQVTHYNVNLKKPNADGLKVIKSASLSIAKQIAKNMANINNFESLTNSNGVKLPL